MFENTAKQIEKFARENGYIEILPVICGIDFLTAKARSAVLYREQTLATGGKMCDYWFVGDKVKISVLPTQLSEYFTKLDNCRKT